MKISIIGGAGTLGSAIAFRLGQISGIKELCLLDVNEPLLLNHLMDLQNAYPNKEIYKGEYSGLAGSNIIIITAGVPNRNDIESRDVFLKGNIKLFEQFGRNIKEFAKDALIMTASNPVDALNYFLYKNFHFSSSQLFGYTLNDSLRFERSVREVMGLSGHQTVNSPVIGEHGSTQVPLFSRIQIDGEKITLAKEKQEVIKEKVEKWFINFNQLNINRTTGWATASGIAGIIDDLVSGGKVNTVGSVILNGQYGINDISIGAPVTISQHGIEAIHEWKLDEKELIDYQKSAGKIKQLLESVS